jgi:hypothetical protein
MDHFQKRFDKLFLRLQLYAFVLLISLLTVRQWSKSVPKCLKMPQSLDANVQKAIELLWIVDQTKFSGSIAFVVFNFQWHLSGLNWGSLQINFLSILFFNLCEEIVLLLIIILLFQGLLNNLIRNLLQLVVAIIDL